MVRVAALFDDLLRGSNVAGALRAAGYEVKLAGAPEQVDPQAQVVVVDLDGGFDALAVAGGPARTLGLYSHVDPETRRRAEAGGFDLVVPRSRFAREGAALVAGLLERP